MKYTTNHTVYYNSKNDEVPSATTILKIINKPALVKWANYLGFKHQSVDRVLSVKSTLGSLIHDMIYHYMKKSIYVYIHTTHEYTKLTVYKCLNNFFKWYKNNEIEPIFMEKSLTTDRFGGTIDFYGKVNNLYTIVDYKTSKKIRLTMFIQLALYCILLESHGHTVEQVGIVLVNEDISDNKFISRENLEPYIKLANVLIDVFHMYYDINKDDKWNDSIL